MICTNPLDDQDIIQKACEMKQAGMFVSDIAKRLSKETGLKITQMALWRMFNNLKDEHLHEYTELDYPSRNEIENLFSELLQKENDVICIYGGEKLKRKLMIRILNTYLYKEFIYTDVRSSLNQWVGESGFYQHWSYLLENNFIERVSGCKFKNEYKFKFCDRVKKWKTFGQV